MKLKEQQGNQNWLERILDQIPEDTSIDKLDALRHTAVEQLQTTALPHRKQEHWRYANLDSLFEQSFKSMTASEVSHIDDIEPYLSTDGSSIQIVLINGRFSKKYSTINQKHHGSQKHPGIIIADLPTAFAEYPDLIETISKNKSTDETLFTMLNSAFIQAGVFIYIAKNIKRENTIEILHLNTSDAENTMIHPRLICYIDSESSLTLIERHIGADNSNYFANHLTQIKLGKQSQLRHYQLQQEGNKGSHYSSQFIEQSESSHYHTASISMGGKWSRAEFTINLNESDAYCDLNGLYLAGDKQMIDFHLNINHQVPNCKSQEKFKGILNGSGRTVFDGRIYVAKNAQHSEAHLSNANLMLSRNAEADTKPQLEIYADDVQCSHGTSIGQLEEQQIFYCQSRGLSREQAETMLCMGFANEIVDLITIETIRDSIKEDIHQRLMKSV